MPSRLQIARVPAVAKINLDLRVLGKRADGYHELRTIFQTISLADEIEIAFAPGRGVHVELEDALAIPDNLVARAANAAMEASGACGSVRMRLRKRIPMGAGLGGGSSDAAAVLLALPVLTGRAIPLARLCEIGRQLGSDVPFFLLGGRAVGIGRGTELFPLPGRAWPCPTWGLLVAPDVHVSTKEAYARLATSLTSQSPENKMVGFQSLLWGEADVSPENDFEEVVFEQHPELAILKKRLKRAGAAQAMMTGSGSSIFGLFPARDGVSRALKLLRHERTFRFTLVTRARYRAIWWRALNEHMNGRTWPPRSRYAR